MTQEGQSARKKAIKWFYKRFWITVYWVGAMITGDLY